MGTYRAFKTDPNLEIGGITLDLGQAGKFKIARAGGANKRFAQRFMIATKPHRRAIQTETMDEETARPLLIGVYVDTVLLGWEGVTDENEQPLPFNRENAIKLFTDLPWLFEEIRRAAEDAALFRISVREADAGNSEPSSATS